MEDFATYISEEKSLAQKMLITYYLSKKTGIFFDKAIVLKTEIASLFIDYMKINVDENFPRRFKRFFKPPQKYQR